MAQKTLPRIRERTAAGANPDSSLVIESWIAGLEPAADSLSGCCSTQMSYIHVRMVVEGPDQRGHTVLQRSRTREALGTSTIGVHRLFTSSLFRINHRAVVVKEIL